jgi:hypothetical protein
MIDLNQYKVDDETSLFDVIHEDNHDSVVSVAESTHPMATWHVVFDDGNTGEY